MNTRWLNGKLVVDGPDVLIDGTSNIEYRSICPKCFYKYLERDVKAPARKAKQQLIDSTKKGKK
jgi:thymidine kinase